MLTASFSERVSRCLRSLCPSSDSCLALRQLRRCCRGRLHRRLQLNDSPLNVCFCRSKSISHDLDGLSDRFFHLYDLFFRCHHVSPFIDRESVRVSWKTICIRAAETEKSNAQEEGTRREGWDSQRTAQPYARRPRVAWSSGITDGMENKSYF